MPGQPIDKKTFSLLEVTRSIQRTLNKRYTSSFWVVVEMNRLNYYRHSGHCYPELVEKKDSVIVAQMRSVIWRDDYRRIDGKFREVLKVSLEDGIKILFEARISFDPVYGLSLRIMDIDPAFTLGDLEKEKQETINRLRQEDLFDRNRELPFPLLPQRIAIISVETSKGYADFLSVLDNNPWSYNFFHLLFPALLEGDRAAGSIMVQLEKIKKVVSHFDAVAIIRGGGADIGLSCYNNYQLARCICTFPIPVITGIGHSTNETVSEMVAFTNAITPTKLAEFLIQKFHNFSVPVKEAEQKVTEYIKRIISDARSRLYADIKLFRSVTKNVLLSHKSEIKDLFRSLSHQTTFRFREERENLIVVKQNIHKECSALANRHRLQLNDYGSAIKKDSGFRLVRNELIVSQLKEKLEHLSATLLKQASAEMNGLEKNIRNMDPDNVLRRGYSITLVHGKAINKVSGIKAGDEISTTLFKGSIISTVTQTHPSKENE